MNILKAMKDALVALEKDVCDGEEFYAVQSKQYINLRAAINEIDKSELLVFVIPEGWQLVPKEPTEAMFDAGDAEIDPGYCEESSSSRFVEDGESIAIYKAMLAAAPEYKP